MVLVVGTVIGLLVGADGAGGLRQGRSGRTPDRDTDHLAQRGHPPPDLAPPPVPPTTDPATEAARPGEKSRPTPAQEGGPRNAGAGRLGCCPLAKTARKRVSDGASLQQAAGRRPHPARRSAPSATWANARLQVNKSGTAGQNPITVIGQRLDAGQGHHRGTPSKTWWSAVFSAVKPAGPPAIELTGKQTSPCGNNTVKHPTGG